MLLSYRFNVAYSSLLLYGVHVGHSFAIACYILHDWFILIHKIS